MNSVWNESVECLPREKMREIQSERLKNVVYKVYQNVEFYRKKMQAAGLEPEDIKSIDDITKLPYTTKEDLRDSYPYGMFAAPIGDIVRIHASSGTTGKPTAVGYTQKDITNWAESVARSIYMAGGSRDSVVQVSYGYGLFTGGLGLHYGAERIGASVIPTSSGNTQKQIMLMKDFGATVLCCTPSYALFLIEAMEEAGISPGDIKLQSGIFGAEPWTKEMRKQIEDRLGIRAYDIYGLSEISGPGVSCECGAHKGMHVQEDFFYPEILDRDTLEPLPNGGKGELVFTTLAKEGMPLIRYRTRDVSSLNGNICDCGRTTVRMSRLLGRTDDMLIIRGVNVFPSQIESVLVKYREIAPYYMIIVSREHNADVLEVQVEFSENLFSDQVNKMEELDRKITHELYSTLSVTAKLTFVEPKSLPRSEGKAKHVIDNRNLTDEGGE